MQEPNPGDIWLDDGADPVLVIRAPEKDPITGLVMCDIARLARGTGSGRWQVAVNRTQENGLDEDRYADVAFLMACQTEALGVLVGRVAPIVLEQIAARSAQMIEKAAKNERQNRFGSRAIDKYDYDVALSFAGADRGWAEQLAQSLTKRRLRVFYDEYEEANLWGKDLVQHLDSVYRSAARYCIVLVSTAYAAGLWPNHELKSALARSLIEHEEYLLPVRLDDTTLPGLRPTVAYVTLRRFEDVERIADMASAKIGHRNLISYAEFSSKWVQNVLEINGRWHLDCLAFCVDRRYLWDANGFECRVGLSYGVNLTSPRIGFLQPSEQSGANVFGIHSVAVVGSSRLCLWDQWVDSMAAPTFDRLEDAVAAAYQALAEIDDERYELLASSSSTENGLMRSSRYLLDEFDISTEIG